MQAGWWHVAGWVTGELRYLSQADHMAQLVSLLPLQTCSARCSTFCCAHPPGVHTWGASVSTQVVLQQPVTEVPAAGEAKGLQQCIWLGPAAGIGAVVHHGDSCTLPLAAGFYIHWQWLAASA